MAGLSGLVRLEHLRAFATGLSNESAGWAPAEVAYDLWTFTLLAATIDAQMGLGQKRIVAALAAVLVLVFAAFVIASLGGSDDEPIAAETSTSRAEPASSTSGPTSTTSTTSSTTTSTTTTSTTSTTVSPAEGDLDPSFGLTGIVFTDFGTNEQATAVAVQQDGKILGIGQIQNLMDFGLARYNQDGALDPTFGTGGRVVSDFGTDNDRATAVAIQADGKIVVAGNNGFDVLLVRYEQDGTLDQTFAGGAVTAGLAGDYRAEGLALQRDGNIVVAGSFAPEGATSYSDLLVMRFLSDGTLDPTFGSGGLVMSAGVGARAVAVQTDGKIVAVGGQQTTFEGCAPDDPCDVAFALVRYNPDGSLDTSFGVGGKVTTGRPGETNEAGGMVVQPDGKIVVIGGRDTRPLAFSDFLVVRYNSDGTLDSSFGAGGEVVTDFGAHDFARAVALQSDGKIVAAGAGRLDDPLAAVDIAVARYHPNGTLDPSFGFGGKVLVHVGNTDGAQALALQPDGKIVIAGFGGSPLWDFALVRLIGTAAG